MTGEARFLKDVATHVMEVQRDDGLYRHIRFRRPGTMCMHFDLITWPGYLCYTGDMGTYVFERLRDMFEFFRTDRRDEDRLCINLGYWSEKLEAVDGHRTGGSATQFSERKFRAAINEHIVQWWRGGGLDAEQRRELREEVERRVLYHLGSDNTGSAAMSAVNDFEMRIGRTTYYFQDFWDHSLDEYTPRFIWCCYALAWGIRMYDAKAKEGVSA